MNCQVSVSFFSISAETAGKQMRSYVVMPSRDSSGRDVGAATTTLTVRAETNKWKMTPGKFILMFDKACIKCIESLLIRLSLSMIKGSNDLK